MALLVGHDHRNVQRNFRRNFRETIRSLSCGMSSVPIRGARSKQIRIHSIDESAGFGNGKVDISIRFHGLSAFLHSLRFQSELVIAVQNCDFETNIIQLFGTLQDHW